jgi:hypothetical protein
MTPLNTRTLDAPGIRHTQWQCQLCTAWTSFRLTLTPIGWLGACCLPVYPGRTK